MSGRLIGIARRAAPKAPNMPCDHAAVGLATGIAGNFRGSIKPGGRGRRQVSFLLAADWAATMADLGLSLDWALRRNDMLVEGVYLPRSIGYRVRVGSALFEITDECTPCSRMETVAPGLKAALTPDWRGGRLGRVVEAGDIRVGDPVTIEDMA